jgi:hypothetical protein
LTILNYLFKLEGASTSLLEGGKMRVGDRVIVKEATLPHMPRTSLTPRQRTGTIVATDSNPEGISVCFVDLGWPVYERSQDPARAAAHQRKRVRALNPRYRGDGSQVIYIAAENIIPT